MCTGIYVNTHIQTYVYIKIVLVISWFVLCVRKMHSTVKIAVTVLIK